MIPRRWTKFIYFASEKKNGVRPKRPSDVGRTIIIVIIIIRVYMGIRHYIGRCLRACFVSIDYTFFVRFFVLSVDTPYSIMVQHRIVRRD